VQLLSGVAQGLHPLTEIWRSDVTAVQYKDYRIVGCGTIVWYMFIDVSDEHNISIIRTEENAGSSRNEDTDGESGALRYPTGVWSSSKGTIRATTLPTPVPVHSQSAYSLTYKLEAEYSSETPVNFYQTTKCHIQNNSKLLY
jgi:hypothetical protein